MTDKPAPAKKAPEKKAPAKPTATKAPATAKSDKHPVTVRSTDKRDFFRCGFRFTPDGVTVELTDDQLTRIKAEPRLVIED